MTNNIINNLREASKDLLYQSESDAPFETFKWNVQGDLTKEVVLKRVRRGPKTAFVEVTLGDFFDGLTAERDWHGVEEKAIVEKYRNLLTVIQSNLTDVRVFKVGSINVTIFIVGKAGDGVWAGLRTMAVET